MLIYLQAIESDADRTKFEQIYSAYRSLMFYVANGILHNEYDSEDMVHSAFVSIAENIEKIDTPICPKTKAYVVTVVECKAIDLYRHRKRHPEVNYDENSVGLCVEYTGTNMIACCLSRLPTRYKNALLLKYRHGYSSKEIAKIMNVSESAAAKLIQRAKTKLDALCREEGIL